MAKKKASFYVPEELLTRARAAVVHLQGPPLLLSMQKLAEDALEIEVTRLEKTYNKGKPFEIIGKVKTGRPVGR